MRVESDGRALARTDELDAFQPIGLWEVSTEVSTFLNQRYLCPTDQAVSSSNCEPHFTRNELDGMIASIGVGMKALSFSN